MWWGYKYTSGTYQAKRYFDDRDLDDARDSPFCEKVVPPFEAANREEALEKVKLLTNKLEPIPVSILESGKLKESDIFKSIK